MGPKIALKKAINKALERGIIKQVKGSGFNGSFKLEKEKPAVKKGDKTKKKSAAPKFDKAPLENQFPNVFTWACNPKEASVPLIRKYLVKHYPELDVEGKAFRSALEFLEKQGQLERITGKGFSGTFQLVDEADKFGHKYEDAIANAVIAMNEPKDVSVGGLRDYLGVYHKEYNTDDRPQVLKNALERAVSKGWLKQVTGKGFSGTYRLAWPFHPSPKELWGADYAEKKDDDIEPTPKKKASAKKEAAAKKPAPESSDEEEDDEDEDAEVMPSPRKRGAPTPRKSVAPAKKKAKKEPETAP